jgi:hypothetical protein
MNKIKEFFLKPWVQIVLVTCSAAISVYLIWILYNIGQIVWWFYQVTQPR